MFDKFDLNGDSKLEFHEIAYFFFNNFHFSLEDAQHYAQQQLNNFDINKDGVLDIWGKGVLHHLLTDIDNSVKIGKACYIYK